MRARLLLVCLIALAAIGAATSASANANPALTSIMMDDDQLAFGNDEDRVRALRRMKGLGVERVRVTLFWRYVAERTRKPRKGGKDPSNPKFYPARNWDRFDRLVRDARASGIAVYFDVTGPGPDWARGKAPKGTRRSVALAWKPNVKQFGKFVTAVGKRYSGRYRGSDRRLIPRVDFWSIWNEPNVAGWLAPQYATDPRSGKRYPLAPRMYRDLYLAGRQALERTGHGKDQIWAGETAPIGGKGKAADSNSYPVPFMRELFCLKGASGRYRGAAAKLRGCNVKRPAGWWRMSGWAHHPYTKFNAPTKRDASPNALTIANLPALTDLMDSIATRTKAFAPGLPLILSEFGYETKPPDPTRRGFPLDKQAEYMNYGDLVAYDNPRVLAQTQFLLQDVKPVKGARGDAKWASYQSGLLFANGKPKPSATAYALPFVVRRGGPTVKLWGQLRFRPNGIPDQVQIQFRPQGSTTWTDQGAPVQVAPGLGFFEAELPSPGPGFWRAEWRGSEFPFVLPSRAAAAG